MDATRFRRSTEILDALSQIAPFDTLPARGLRELAAWLTFRTFGKGAVIFARGAASETFYFMLDGVVALEAQARDGQAVLVEMIATPGPLDAAAVLSGTPYAVQAVARQPVQVLELPAAAIRALAAREPAFAAALFAIVARQYQVAIDHISDLRVMNTEKRLGAYLLEQATQAAPTEDGTIQMRLPIAKNQIASKIGVVPESLSRAFTGLRRIGVSTRGREVQITNMDRLRAFCTSREEARCAG